MLCLDCVRNLFSMRRRYDCNVEEEFAAASRASFLSPPRAVAIDAPEPRRAQSIAESLESEAAREVEELKNVITDLYKQNKLQRECHRKKQRRSEPLPAAKPGVDAAPAVPGTARRVSWQNRVKFHILAGEATPTDFSSGDPPKEPSDETFSQEITAGNGMAAAAAAATAASIFMKQASQPAANEDEDGKPSGLSGACRQKGQAGWGLLRRSGEGE
eukprot:tig00000037_g10110.t1